MLSYLSEGHITFISAVTHIVNVFYVLIDVLITATPVRLLHFYLAALFALYYSIFSVIIQLGMGHEALYSIADFHNAPCLATGIVFMTVVVFSLSHALMFFLHWMRLVFYKNYCYSMNSKAESSVDNFSRKEDEDKVATEMETMIKSECENCA